MRQLAILGSTGSIGEQTLELVRKYPDHFQVYGLLARGSRLDKLISQVQEFSPKVVAVVDPIGSVPSSWLQGKDAPSRFIDQAASHVDMFINAIDGIAGVQPTRHIVATKVPLALANKESIVCAGKIILPLAKKNQIWPVDSEHSAIFQAAQAGRDHEISRLVLTASGGALYEKNIDDLSHVTIAEAVDHPTWSMGQLISLNSANLVNKALELIEAHELFSIDYDQIDITIHRQSIIHSMVTFCDGSTIAQASPPSMLIPIAYAISQGQRLLGASSALDFTRSYTWTFEPVDSRRFPVIELARQVGKTGGVFPAIFNAAAEDAGRLFLASAITFTDIIPLISSVLDHARGYEENFSSSSAMAMDDIYAAISWARQEIKNIYAREYKKTVFLR